MCVCVSVCLSVRLFVCLSICRSVSLYACQSVPVYLSISLAAYLSEYLSICVSACVRLYLSVSVLLKCVSVSVFVSVCRSICLSVRVPSYDGFFRDGLSLAVPPLCVSVTARPSVRPPTAMCLTQQVLQWSMSRPPIGITYGGRGIDSSTYLPICLSTYLHASHSI